MLRGYDKTSIVCDVGGVTHPDAATVDALARMELAARRAGLTIKLRRASRDLTDLITFMGLDEVLVVELVLEPEREPEHREEARRVEEEADPRDLPA